MLKLAINIDFVPFCPRWHIILITILEGTYNLLIFNLMNVPPSKILWVIRGSLLVFYFFLLDRSRLLCAVIRFWLTTRDLLTKCDLLTINFFKGRGRSYQYEYFRSFGVRSFVEINIQILRNKKNPTFLNTLPPT